MFALLTYNKNHAVRSCLHDIDLLFKLYGFYESGTKNRSRMGVFTRSLKSCTSAFKKDSRAVALIQEKWLYSLPGTMNLLSGFAYSVRL